MYLNKCFIIGNISNSPELKSLPSGIKTTSFSVATNRVWKDKDGSKKEAADFHNVVIFGRQAETVCQYLAKGSQVLIEGRMQTRSWKTDGIKKYRTEVIADAVQFGNRKSSEREEVVDKNKNDLPSEEVASGSEDEIEYPEEDVNISDIPF